MTRGSLDWKRIVTGVAIVAYLLVLIPVVVAAVPQAAGADHSFVVQSGSMEPAIQAGGLVLVNEVDPTTIETGDVITFTPPAAEDSEFRTTHRVIEVNPGSQDLTFTTMGDATGIPDSAPVPAENVIGVVSFHIPFVGYVVNFANTGTGILLLVVVPAVLLLVAEARDILAGIETDDASSSRIAVDNPGERNE